MHRSDDSGTTENFTDYLNQASNGHWKWAKDGVWPIKGGESGEGTSGLVAAVKAGQGTIGYADESQAGSLGQAAVKVGSTYNKPSAEGAAKVLAVSPRTKGRGENDMAIDVDRTTTESGAYPIMLTSYLLACPTYDNANDADAGEGPAVLHRVRRRPAGRRQAGGLGAAGLEAGRARPSRSSTRSPGSNHPARQRQQRHPACGGPVRPARRTRAFPPVAPSATRGRPPDPS